MVEKKENNENKEFVNTSVSLAKICLVNFENTSNIVWLERLQNAIRILIDSWE